MFVQLLMELTAALGTARGLEAFESRRVVADGLAAQRVQIESGADAVSRARDFRAVVDGVLQDGSDRGVERRVYRRLTEARRGQSILQVRVHYF